VSADIRRRWRCGLDFWRDGLDQPTAVAAVVALLGLLFVLARVHHAGTGLEEWFLAYDGQYYFHLAHRPFAFDADMARLIEWPAYRHQRLLYPVLVWALSVGQPDLIPLMMVVVNLLFLCGMAWLAAGLAQSSGRHAFWGLFIPLYPGFLLVLTRDLAEIVAVTFLLAAVHQVRRGSHVGTAACFTCAALTRETTLLCAACWLLWLTLSHRRRSWVHCATAALPFVVWLGWQLAIRTAYGEFGALPRGGGLPNLGRPLVGVLSFVAKCWQSPGIWQQLWLVEIGVLVVLAAGALVGWRAVPGWPLEKIAWPAYLVMMLCLTRAVWVEDWAFLRVGSEFAVLGALLIYRKPSLPGVVALSSWVVLWLQYFGFATHAFTPPLWHVLG
jgi:hypothetical protein